VTLLFALASLAALREFVPREAAAGTPAWVLRGSFALVLPLQYLLIWNGNPLLYSLFIPACVLLVLPLLGLLSGRPDTFMSHARSLRAGLLICVYAVSHVPALLTLHLRGPALQQCLPAGVPAARRPVKRRFPVSVGKARRSPPDCAEAVTVKNRRRNRRRHPECQRAGRRTGIADAVYTRIEAMLISLLITLLGFLGGLAMSAIKRRRGIKDWGTLIPGHGGMLDRIDSLCLSAPVFYYLLRCGWAT
jgi:phosphatidate cytidylyltransferase